MRFKLNMVSSAVLLLAMTACGGGGDSGVTSAVSTSGVAVDGYLLNSKVVCDANDNGVADSSETYVYTGANGAFSFINGCSHGVIVSDGYSADTTLSLVGILKAPAGATVASPLTTLLVAGVTSSQLISSLGLAAGTSITTTDPAATTSSGALVNADLLKKTLAVQQVLQKTTELFVGLAAATGSTTVNAVYSVVASSFARSLSASASSLVKSDSSLDLSVLQTLISNAATSVQASASVPDAVKTALSTQTAAVLGVVAAGGLKVQADAILQVSGTSASSLSAVTKVQQSDDRLTSIVVQSQDELKSATTSSVAALATRIATSIADTSYSIQANNYLTLANDQIALVNGSSSQSFSVTQFQSTDGIRVSWPLQSAAVLQLKLSRVGTFTLTAGEQLSAAVEVTQVTPSGSGVLRGYIDPVNITKSGDSLTLTIPSTAYSRVYGVSSDGLTQAVVEFSNAVRGVSNTLTMVAATATSITNQILIGDVFSYGINQVSNDFSGITALRGKFKVTVVVKNLPLRTTAGKQFSTYSISTPVQLDSTGATSKSVAVTGPGLQGYITLTD